MKKGQIYQGTVTGVEFPNKGTVVTEEGNATVKNVIPGQVVEFAVNKVRKGKAEGRLLQVINKSECENNENLCPHFGTCGGCTYQSVNYDTQLSIKAGQVKKLIDAVCSDYEFEGIIGSPITEGYRNKMEYSFGDEFKDGPLSLGMHKRGSFHDIVTVTECRIVHEDFRKILKCITDYFRESNIPFYHKMQHEGYLRHLLIRRAVKTGEIMVCLVTTTQMEVNDDEWVDSVKSLDLQGTLTGVLHTYNDSLADIVQSDRTEVLYGRDYIYEELLGLRFKISVFSFFQTNSLGAEVLYSKAREYVGNTKDMTIFDLYSGTGTIAQILAPVAKEVIGVEIVEEAVEAAKVNAELNGLSNCRFIAGDVLKVIDDIEEKPDFIVLDPPRDGIHPKAIEKIINYGVDRMVYISCKPTSLARDIEIFEARGYKVQKVCCIDQFPGTVHIETVALISKVK